MNELERRVQETLDCFCVNVKKLRERAGISQERLAQEAKLPLTTLKKVEQGVVEDNVPVDFLINICRYFQVSADSLVAPFDLEQEQEKENHADGKE